jgi:RNA polymerase-binding transcription factor DksA
VETDPAAGRSDADHINAGATDAGDLAPLDVDIELDAIERDLADVELALERLGDGSYGRCETCGQALTDEELESGPANRFCRTHLPLDLS